MVNKQRTPSTCATLREIAVVAKLSKSTVSLALHNHPRIPKSTRLRVLEIANSVGYSPDPFLDYFSRFRRAVRRNQMSGVIAFVSDQPSQAVFKASRRHHEIFAGAEVRAEEQGCRIELFLVGNSLLTIQRLDRVLAVRNITSVILGAFTSNARQISLDWSRLCGVGIESLHISPRLDNVVFDYRSAARITTTALRARRSSRIGFALPSSLPSPLVDLIRAGYLIECDGFGDMPIPFLLLDHANPSTWPTLLQKWARKYSLNAIVAGDDTVFKVITSSLSWSSRRPSLTSLQLPSEELDTAGIEENYRRLGAHAVELVNIRQRTHSAGLPQPCSTILLPASWRAAAPEKARAHTTLG